MQVSINFYYFEVIIYDEMLSFSVVDKDIAHDYSQVKCTFVDPSIPPEDAVSFRFIFLHLFSNSISFK